MLHGKKIQVKPGNTISGILSEAGISTVVIYHLLKLPEAKKLKYIKPGSVIYLLLNRQPIRLEEMRYHVSPLNYISFLRKEDDRFIVKNKSLKPETRIAKQHVIIEESLFLSGSKAGVSKKLLMQLIDIFGTSIDFVFDIHKEDSFSFVYEEYFIKGKKISTGPILAARFTDKKTSYRCYSL